MKKNIDWLYWIPRILAIFFVLFLMLFSLDVIQPGLSIEQILIGLLMHNIPAFLLLIVVIISWKHELFGAIVFTLAGLVYILNLILNLWLNGPIDSSQSTMANLLMILGWSLTIALPAIAVGILFYISWRRKKYFNKK